MEINTVKIAILQMCSAIADVDANCQKIKTIVDRELPHKTDVLVLPEVWTCGWACSCFRETAQKFDDSSVLSFLSDLAKDYSLNIIGGSFISVQNGKFYNTCPVINKKGELVDIYNKNHLYSYYGCDEGKYITKGENPVLVELDGVKYGLSICYDIRFPEIYRAYAKAGADVLINCAAWGSNKPIPWEMMTKSRAIENQCYMVALTQTGHIKDNEYNLGESRIIDYKGEELSSIIKNEGIASAILDLNKMYDFRSKCDILNDIKNKYEVKMLCAE